MKKYLYKVAVASLSLVFMTGCATTGQEGTMDTPTSSGIVDTTTDSAVEESVVEESVEPEEIIYEPVYGETLSISCRNPETLNPLANSDYSVDQVLRLINEPLFYLDESYHPVANLVEDVEYFTDNNSIILTLKEGIYFQNGTQLTAYDVAFSIEQLLDVENTSMYKSLVGDIARVSVVDDFNVKIYYNQGLALATYRLTFPILSKDYYYSEEYDAFEPIGLGAYSFENFTAMQDIQLTVNDNYFKDRPYVSYINCVITRNTEGEDTAFDQTLIDVTNPSKFDWLQFSEDRDVTLVEYTTNYYDFIGFNFSNDVLANQNVRKAIAQSIDREAIVSTYYLDHAVVNDYLTHPESFYNPESNRYSYDVNRANSTLALAPLSDMDGDGYYDSMTGSVGANFQLSLLVNSDNSIRLSVANEIKDSLAEIGLEVIVDDVPRDEFYEKLSTKDFDLVLSGWKLSSVPDYTQLFHSSYIESGSNFIGYSNEMMDLYLGDIYQSNTEESLLESIQTFNEFFAEELPYFSLYFANSTVMMNDGVQGQLTPTTENNLFGIEELFIVK